MALESATYVNQLNAANPPAGDPIINAADHLRLIKSCLLASFPLFTGAAVSATEAQITLGLVPPGIISMWSGSIATIPVGYGLCNGTTYPKSSGVGTITSPNLQDQFIIGAGDIFPVGGQGGSSTVSGTVTIGSTALTVNQLPNFTITISDPGHNHYVNDPGHAHSGGATGWGVRGSAGSNLYAFGNPGNTGGSGTGIWLSASATGISASPVGLTGAGHSHTGTFSGLNLPPYYALAFIMKL